MHVLEDNFLWYFLLSPDWSKVKVQSCDEPGGHLGRSSTFLKIPTVPTMKFQEKFQIPKCCQSNGRTIVFRRSGLCSMKNLGVISLPPGWDPSPSHGYPQHCVTLCGRYPSERENMEQSCLLKITWRHRPGLKPQTFRLTVRHPHLWSWQLRLQSSLK